MRLTYAMTLLLTLTLSANLSADLTVDVLDAQITAGGKGFIDVVVTSDSNVTLSFVGYEFVITGDSTLGELRFRPDYDQNDPSNSDRQNNAEQSLSSPPYDYVFLGDTDPANFSAATPDTTSLTGGDITGSLADVALAAGVQYLLARLELEHVTPNPAAAVGSVFTVSLVDSGNTAFGNNGGDVPVAPQSFLNSGNVSVTATPEPSSLTFGALIGVGLIGRGVVRRFRRRRSQADLVKSDSVPSCHS